MKRLSDDPAVRLAECRGEPVSLIRCSFCDTVDGDGNPWTGGWLRENYQLQYRVWGCKDHHAMAKAALECAQQRSGEK